MNSYIEKKLLKQTSKKYTILDSVESLLTCPCCDYKTIQEKGSYEICPVCKWENDGNDDINVYSSCNRLTLKEGISNFKKYGACDERSIKYVILNPSEKYPKN